MRKKTIRVPLDACYFATFYVKKGIFFIRNIDVILMLEMLLN